MFFFFYDLTLGRFIPVVLLDRNEILADSQQNIYIGEGKMLHVSAKSS